MAMACNFWALKHGEYFNGSFTGIGMKRSGQKPPTFGRKVVQTRSAVVWRSRGFKLQEETGEFLL
jgi:hypothetical protein